MMNGELRAFGGRGRGWHGWAALAGLLALCWVVPARAEDAAAKSERLFREGVDFYKQGRHTEAQAKLRELLALEPRKEMAARLVEEASTRLLASMMAEPGMGNEPARLWNLYRKYYVAKRADKERMIKLAARVVDPSVSEDERVMLYREFAELGHYAVPCLAPYLKDPTHDDFRTQARIVLARIGPPAVLPLIELLGHRDEIMRTNAVLTLMDIRPLDARALPALKARLEDPKETAGVKRYAERMLETMTGLKAIALKSAATYYYLSANRYYLGLGSAAEEGDEVDGFIWHLDDNGELVPVLNPLWSWELQMAEDVVLKGMKLEPDQTDYYPLAACIYAAQYMQVKSLLDIVGEEPAQQAFSEEEKQIVLAWDKKLVDCRNLASACGAPYVNEALLKVLRDMKKYPGHGRLGDVGVFLCRTLADLDPWGALLPAASAALPSVAPPVGTGRGETLTCPAQLGGSIPPVAGEGDQRPLGHSCALVQAMDCTDMEVQYEAALSLAAVNRYPASWIGAEKVAGLLGRGVSENKPLQILVVEEAQNVRNQVRLELEKLGFNVTDAVNGRDGLLKGRSFPPKDIILVADTLRVDMNAEQLIEELKADVRTRYVPYAILHDRATRTATQARFGTDMLLVEREMQGEDLRAAVNAVDRRRSSEATPKRRAEQIAVACATALSHVDPRATHLVLNDAVPHCYNALVNRKDEVRIPAALFLGYVQGGSLRDQVATRLKEVFALEENAVEIRLAALKALARVKPEAFADEALKAQTDPKLAGEKEHILQEWAAINFGSALRTNNKLVELLNAKRVDKEKKEK